MTNRLDAVYVRKSSDPQEEQSQIKAIKDYLDRKNIKVPQANWFVEVGQRHRPEDRPKFQRLMRLVEQGRIARVFVWKQNRVVSGVKLSFKYLYEFERTRTQLIDVLTDTDLASDDVVVEITTTIAARKARDDVKQLAEDVMRARVSLAKEGMPQAKHAPFGYDKFYSDKRGNHLWTSHLLDSGRWLIINPDGSEVERESSPRKAKSDRIKYVPSVEKKRVDIIKTIFHTYATESITERTIAVRLNQSGRLHYGKPWLRSTVLQILRNPAYIGSVRNLSVTQAEFSTYDGENFVKADNPDRKTIRTPEREIIVPDQHEAIVDITTWNTVQEKLKKRKTRCQPPRREDLYLRGVLYCGRCQQPLHVFTGNKKKASHMRGYICSSYYYYNQTHAEQHNTGCPRSFISHERAEALVKDRLNVTITSHTPDNDADEIKLLRLRLGIDENELGRVLSEGVYEYMMYLKRTLVEAGEKEADIRLANKVAKEFPKVKMTKGKGDMLDAIIEMGTKYGGEHLFGVELIQKLFILFEEERTKAAAKKLVSLKSDFERSVKAKIHATSDRERGIINATLNDLDAEIVKWEAAAVPLDEQLATLRGRLEDYRKQLDATVKALAGSENLRKAELIRGLYSKVVLHFETVQKAKIRDSVFHPEKTEFVDNLEDSSA